jgi:hypothetical protein
MKQQIYRSLLMLWSRIIFNERINQFTANGSVSSFRRKLFWFGWHIEDWLRLKYEKSSRQAGLYPTIGASDGDL